MALKTILIILACTRIMSTASHVNKEDAIEIRMNLINDNLPVACNDKTFCSEEDFLQEGKIYNDWNEHWKEQLDDLSTQPNLEPIEWEQTPNISGQDDCGSHQAEKITLRFVREDTADDWYPAAYSPKKYEQTFFIQECKDEYAPCFKEMELVGPYASNSAVCGQELTYIIVNVWKNGSIRKDSYALPAYCSCKIDKS